MKVLFALLVVLASTEAARRCFFCAPVGAYAKHPPWERWTTTTPRSTSPSSDTSTESIETTISPIEVDEAVPSSKGKKTPGLRMKGSRTRVEPRVEPNEVQQPSSVVPGLSRQLYETCEAAMAKRGRYHQSVEGSGIEPGPSEEPRVQFQDQSAGSPPRRPCRGRNCVTCSEPGERCAAQDSTDSDEGEDHSALSAEDRIDQVMNAPLSPGQLPLDHRLCEAVLSAGCCNPCPAGACHCGLNARCEQYLRNGFERFREYLTRYKIYLRTTTKAPVDLYGPYRDTDPEVSTPPPPGGSAALVGAAAAAVVRCRFGVHRLPRSSLIDCPPQHVLPEEPKAHRLASFKTPSSRSTIQPADDVGTDDLSGYKIWRPRKKYGFGIYGR